MITLRKKLLLVSVMVALWGGLKPAAGQAPSPQDVIPGAACTSFCLNNADHAVFGANFDNGIPFDGLLFVNKRNVSKMSWETGPHGEQAAWTSLYGSVTFNHASYQFAWAGMNEAGLVISTMIVAGTTPTSDDRPPLIEPVWVQYILDTCATIDEVIATDDDVRTTLGSHHFLVCDQTATCAVIEFLDGKMVTYTSAELPISALANTAYVESLETWQAKASEGAEITSDGSSLARFMVAANRVQGFTPQETAVDYAFETLAMASNSDTRWSIVFDAEKRAIHFRTWDHAPIRSLYFDELDFSCQTPVRMINLRAELEGNIATDLIDYDHDISLAHMVNFLRLSGRATRESDTDQLMQMMEAFACDE